MAQVTGPLTIANGAGTPVNKSFAPERVAPELSSFVERSAPASAGYVRLSVGLNPATSQRPTNRIPVRLDHPVLQTANGVSTVAYVGRFVGEFIIPDQMTSAERADLHAFAANALDNALIKGAIKDLDPLY